MAKKVCGMCKQAKPEGEFCKKAKSPDGLQNRCKRCTAESMKAYRKAHPEKTKAWQAATVAWCKKRYAEDPEFREKKKTATREWRESLTEEERKAFNRKTWLWFMYRLRPEAFEKAKEDQNGVCACCGQIPAEWIIDHCHDTGLVRGLVCRKCNNGLGSFDDDITGLEKAIAYLRAFNDRDKET